MKKMMILLVILMVLVLSACTQTDEKLPIAETPAAEETVEAPAQETEAETPQQAEGGVYQTITPEDAVAMIGQENVFLIDVRTELEYTEGHISGSILFPLDQLADIGTLVDDLEATVIVYCRSGNRSRQAATLLLEMGYQTVFDLGGIQSWPYEVVTD